VSVSYVGWLDGGKVFDDSKGEPFSFKAINQSSGGVIVSRA
jgi:FKBP-type peptidyl-prolyl cis-trans isomerase